MESKYGQWDREDGAGHYEESFARENYDYVKVCYYERIICLNEEWLYGQPDPRVMWLHDLEMIGTFLLTTYWDYISCVVFLGVAGKKVILQD